MIISYFQENYSYFKREFPLSFILIYFFFYPTIVKRTFEIYDCEYYDKLGYFISTNYSVKCWTSKYKFQTLNYSIPSIIIWAFGVPGIILIFMIKSRKKLQKTDFKLIFSPLFNGYRSNIFYWEFIVIYRKLILISILLFIKSNALQIKGLTLTIILGLSIYLQYIFKPYNSKEFNSLENYFLLAIYITSYLGLYFLQSNLSFNTELLISLCIITLNTGLLLVWVFWMLRVTTLKFLNFLGFLGIFRLLKRDSFDDEFYVEKIKREGIVKSENLDKDTFTLFRAGISDEQINNFDISDMESLYEATVFEEDI